MPFAQALGMPGLPFRRSTPIQYLLAVFSSLLAAFLIMPFRSTLSRGVMAPFLGAVMASAWFGGLGPGLVATVLSMALSAYLFLEPTYSLAVQSADDIAQLVVFSMVAVFVSILNTAQKRAHALLEAGQERMTRLNEELESRVRERTAWLQLVFEVIRSANDAQTLHQAIRTIMPLIGAGGDWEYVHAFVASSEHSPQLRLSPFYFAKDRAQIGPLHQKLMESSDGGGEETVDREALLGKLEWTMDLRSDPSVPAALRQSDLRLKVRFPVSAEGEVIAIFECFRFDPSERNEHIVNLFQTVSTELGLVVERKRLQEGYAEVVWNQQRAIAQELHDGLGQVLAGVGFLSQSLSQKLPDPAHSALSHKVTEGIEKTLGQIRGLAKGVFPMELESGGLISALRQLASSVESVYPIQCRYEGDSAVEIEDSQIANHLYRMAQEAVTNAAKHARPTKVTIRLWESEAGINLSIADDGIGMPKSGQREGGSGLRTLRCRAAAIGAILSIESASGKGTRILCTVSSGSAPRRPEAPLSKGGPCHDHA